MRDGQSLQHGGQSFLLEHHQRHLPARRLQSDVYINQTPSIVVGKPRERQKKPLAANQSSQGWTARGLGWYTKMSKIPTEKQYILYVKRAKTD